MSASLTSTNGIVAIAAAAVAVVGFLWAAYLALALRRVRAAQRVLLGETQTRDLASHAAELDNAFRELREYVEQASRHMEDRVAGAEERLLGAVAHRALVRYDAYNEHSGKQSLSIALLDATRSGVVLTCIHHRDQARVYAKQLRDGESELELSPEEAEAVSMALASPAQVSA
ncbi:MAG: DUF4446 family protein [Solirubrobacteraceae bacterium]